VSTSLPAPDTHMLMQAFRPTAQVLDHFDHEINEVLGGVEDTNGQKQHVRVALLAGADLVRLFTLMMACFFLSSAANTGRHRSAP
jgi:hypothetical protein